MGEAHGALRSKTQRIADQNNRRVLGIADVHSIGRVKQKFVFYVANPVKSTTYAVRADASARRVAGLELTAPEGFPVACCAAHHGLRKILLLS